MDLQKNKAWTCLSELERKALYLNFSQGLSTRKSGEILGVTHYKYLEIKARAERFFKLFTDYFNKYPDLVNPNSPVSERFRDYLYACILKRMAKSDAVYSVGDSKWLLTQFSNKSIGKDMQLLKDSKEGSWDHDLYKLVVEFDRWNNFRILPREYQAISPFGRRSTKKYKMYVNYLHRIPDKKIFYLIDTLWNSGITNVYYVVMLSNALDNGYIVMPIKEKDIPTFSKMRIYAFKDMIDADLYGVLLLQYHERTMTRRDGLLYWKEYREAIEKAVNYAYINNLDFGYFAMDEALGLKRKKFIRSKETLEKIALSREKKASKKAKKESKSREK